MQLFGRKFTKLQAVGAAALAMLPLLYFLVRVGGDFDFVANLFGWSDWQSDTIDFLISPPVWIVPLYVLVGVSFILLGERRLNDNTSTELRTLIENLEAKQSAVTPEAKAIRAKARIDFLTTFIPMLENKRVELNEAWNAAKSGYFGRVKEPMSLNSSHEYPLTELRNASHFLKDTVQSALMGQENQFLWENHAPLQFPVDGDEIATDTDKLTSYRTHYHGHKLVIKNTDAFILDLKSEMSRLNSEWSGFGYMPKD